MSVLDLGSFGFPEGDDDVPDVQVGVIYPRTGEVEIQMGDTDLQPGEVDVEFIRSGPHHGDDLFGGLRLGVAEGRAVTGNTRPWCEVCKIPFEHEERIVRSNTYGTVSSTTYYEHHKTQLDCMNGSQTVRVSVQDELPEPVVWTYHPECSEERLKVNLPWSILPKMAHSYVPTVTESERRLDRLHQKLTNGLDRHYEKLPTEICHGIAGLCLPTLLSAHAMLTEKHDDRTIMIFRTDREIWARIVKFEGRAYVARLMNTPPPPPEGKASIVVKLRKPERPVRVMYVAFDYAGIRRLVFGLDDEPPIIPPQDGLWWATVFADRTTYTCESDGMKLRRMRAGAPFEPGFEHGFEWSQCWSTPQPWNNLPPLYYIRTLDTSNLTRIKFVECNLPAITGYSVRWAGQLSSIHAHVHGETDFAFYDEVSRQRPRAVWLYMPLDEGELIEQFWLRSDKNLSDPSSTLIMKTNGNRVWEAGPRPAEPEQPKGPAWTILTQSTEAKRFFFNESYFGISTLGFPPRPLRGDVPLPLPRVLCPKSEPEWLLSSEQRFYSSAPLDGVFSINICLDLGEEEEEEYEEEVVVVNNEEGEERTPNIIGLLFSYRDGRQRSVGHVRLDWLQGPTLIEASRGIAFKLSKDSQNVVDLRIGDHAAGEGWEFIPFEGKLAWWFTVNRCELIHEDPPSMLV